MTRHVTPDLTPRIPHIPQVKEMPKVTYDNSASFEVTLTHAPRTSSLMSAFSPKLAPAPSLESSLYDLSVVGESAPPTYTETSPARVEQNTPSALQLPIQGKYN